MATKAQARTIDQAVSQAALTALSKMTPDAFVKQLKARGITSLEDLAKTSISTAKGALNSGLSEIDPEIFGVCYKFTVKPHRFTQTDLGAITKVIQERAINR
jgi:hypothetical protein